jgi:hypothetical protein
MSDTKFLGLCVLLAACMISATIIWSTKANVEAMIAMSPSNNESAPTAAAPSGSMTVTLSGPVTLAPITTPIPVTIATPNGTPIIVKNAADKQWTR